VTSWGWVFLNGALANRIYNFATLSPGLENTRENNFHFRTGRALLSYKTGSVKKNQAHVKRVLFKAFKSFEKTLKSF